MIWKKIKHGEGKITYTARAPGQEFSVQDTNQNCFCIRMNGEAFGYAPDLLTAFRIAEEIKEAKYTGSEREEFTYPREGITKD